MAKKKNWYVLYHKKRDEFVAVENKEPWTRTPETIGGMEVVGMPYSESAADAIDWIKSCQRR